MLCINLFINTPLHGEYFLFTSWLVAVFPTSVIYNFYVNFYILNSNKNWFAEVAKFFFFLHFNHVQLCLTYTDSSICYCFILMVFSWIHEWSKKFFFYFCGFLISELTNIMKAVETFWPQHYLFVLCQKKMYWTHMFRKLFQNICQYLTR